MVAEVSTSWKATNKLSYTEISVSNLLFTIDDNQQKPQEIEEELSKTRRCRQKLKANRLTYGKSRTTYNSVNNFKK